MTALEDRRFDKVLGVRRGTDRADMLLLIDVPLAGDSTRRLRLRFVPPGAIAHGLGRPTPAALVEMFDITNEPAGTDVRRLEDLGRFVRRRLADGLVADMQMAVASPPSWTSCSIGEGMSLTIDTCRDVEHWLDRHLGLHRI